MRLKIGSRKSDLARIQAYMVGTQIKKLGHEPDYIFRESLGDQNQNDPLWRMPEKGVFTEDFIRGLNNGEYDLVVHSWKDLPTADRETTEIVATLPRADMRDILLLPKKRFSEIQRNGKLQVLSSSPRREYNLRPLLAKIWPSRLSEINFHPVRGNIQTRVRKLLKGDGDALIVAKAALDRMLTAEQPEFAETRSFLRQAVGECLVMVFPLSANPPAAAQGAVAIEIRKDRPELKALLSQLNCIKTFANCKKERQILAGHGGGCHQKIGVAVFDHAFGKIEFLKGLTDAQVTLSERHFLTSHVENSNTVPLESLWSARLKKISVFKEHPLPEAVAEISKFRAIYVSKANALPESYVTDTQQIFWAAGLETWSKLAARGVWVSGCSDSLGEETPAIEDLLGETLQWTKLGHQEGIPSMNLLVTYKLLPLAQDLKLQQASHFYWSSFSQFKQVTSLHPELLNKHHACGPGVTARLIKDELASVEVFLDEEDWQNHFKR